MDFPYANSKNNKYALIAGLDRHHTIGKGNRLPWRLPADMQFFIQKTLGKAVVMGRNTWESLPRKPLPDRLNIVVSSRLCAPEDNSYRVARSIDDALAIADSAGKQAMIIGGERLYREALERAREMFITHIDAEIEGGDTFFPNFDPEEWQREHLDDFVADTHNQYGGKFYRYYR